MSEQNPKDLPEAPIEDNATWWDASLTRRDINALGGVSVLLGMSGLSLTLSGCCGDSDTDSEVESAAVTAQKKYGWDVGDSGKKLKLTGATTKDSQKSTKWKEYKKASKLMKATRPSKKWRPYESPTLFQSLEQKGLAEQIKPVVTASMKELHKKALALASLINATKDPSNTLLVLDMEGHESVAVAAGMAALVEPIFFFDNWPHPMGVVNSGLTLGAALYFADEMKERAKARGKLEKTAAALVLDKNRINEYKDDSKAFDNRYLASMPDAKAMATLGVTNILYVTAVTQDKMKESDDLNDLFVDLEAAGIKITAVGMDAFAKDPEAPAEMNTSTGGYYYGGGHRHHTHFFMWYPMFLYFPGPRYSSWPSRSTAPRGSTARKPTYSPKSRTTMYSTRTTGARSGVGRTKPAGFGRVSTRKGANGSVSRSASRSAASRSGSSRSGSGRSGSFGRSRGGGGSFG